MTKNSVDYSGIVMGLIKLPRMTPQEYYDKLNAEDKRAFLRRCFFTLNRIGPDAIFPGDQKMNITRGGIYT